MENNFDVEIIERDPRTFHFHPANPRDHSDEAVATLAESIQEDPLYFRGRPVLLSDRTGELVVIGGEGRTRAALLLGLDTVPSVVFHGLDEESEGRIMIKDNTHSGEWNIERLRNWNRAKLKMWGVNESLGAKKLEADEEFEKKFNSYNNRNAEYPIAPIYDEDYEVICIVCKTNIDANWVREKLNMNKMASYKRGEIGKSNVISFEDFRNAID